MARVLAAFIAVVAVLASSPRLAAQAPPSSEPAATLVDRYRALLIEYRSGDTRQAISTLSSWNGLDTVVVQRHAKWTQDWMWIAALLETETAFSSPQIQRVGARVEYADQWLSLAERVESRADSRTFRRQWSLAVGQWLTAHGVPAAAGRFLANAARRFSGDPEIHLAWGTALESVALSLGIDPAAPESAAAAVRQQYDTAISAAKAALERAVTSRPAAPEAALRLARVHVLQRADARAVPLLETARQPGAPAPVAYVAALLLGEIQARRGQLPAARALFEEARRLFPGAQSADLADARVLQSAGQAAAAAALLETMLARNEPAPDPWRRYPLGFADLTKQFAALREAVRQ